MAQILVHYLLQWLFGAAGLFLGYLLYQRYRAGLYKIPGPLAASISNLPKFLAVKRQAAHRWNRELHDQYGPVVRLGPNHVSFASPNALHVIHGSREAYAKSEFYDITAVPNYEGHEVVNVFALRDQARHFHLKKNISSLYTKQSIAALEGHIDDSAVLTATKFAERIAVGESRFDMSKWLHFYSFDSLCSINVSKKFGFLERGQDIGGVLNFSDNLMERFGLLAQLPTINKTIKRWKGRKGPKRNGFYDFAVGNLEQRIEKPSEKQDMLDGLLKLHQQDPTKLTKADVVGAIYINILAGHDVLAVTLRSIFYHLALYPDAQQKLRREIQTSAAGLTLDQALPYAKSDQLPYLEAIIYESLRIHPNTGTTLERYVPDGGANIDGYFLPAGTTVGCNAWVIHRNKDIYGEDVDTFRPDRWLKASPESLAEMKRSIFSFGAGPRLCIGRNIAWLQIHKVVVQLLRQFSFELAEPEHEWHIAGGWITKQTEMDMIVTPLKA